MPSNRADRRQAPPQTRQERAAATRVRICEAAEELFRERGYSATTMEAVGRRAGVAVQTVYFTFRTKGLLFLDVIVHTAHGSRMAGATAKLNPPFIQALSAEQDPQRLLALSVEHGHDLMLRFAPLWRYVGAAAEGDPEFTTRFLALIDQRRTAIRGIVAMLDARGALRVSVDRAVDTYFLLRNPEVITLSSTSLGWSPEKHKAWTWEILVTQLLRDAAPRAAAARGLSFAAEVTHARAANRTRKER